MSNLLSFLMMLFTFILRLSCPAASGTVTGPEYQVQDPAYSIYQKYRYAYDTYGYLFCYSDSEEVILADEIIPEDSMSETDSQQAVSGPAQVQNAVFPALAKLQDYDYLMKHFYSVNASTTAGRELMQAEALLGTDLSLEQDGSVPQILIYHTHSQETYADYGPENRSANVVTVGRYLAELLRQKGWNVVHDESSYDIQGGKLDRSKAYNYALEGITGILQRYPSVQVILDVHRDGVADQLRLVSEVNGKPTANVMFFHGLSRTPDGPIAYLPNPYLQENLAFSFQMQYLASGTFPGFTRKIYLKGLRYNLHLRPRSSLIEAGAQTNTLSEAMNAMEPLAELLDMVLQGK